MNIKERREKIRDAHLSWLDGFCLFVDVWCPHRSQNNRCYSRTLGGYDCLCKRLSSLGVVIVGEGEWPECAIPIVCPLLKAGYKLTYSLKEE